MITIPEKHYVGYQSDSDLPLGFATPVSTDAAFAKRKSTVDNWASQYGCKLFKAAEVFDNVLMEGFCISRSVKRTGWNGGNVVWRIEDPRGFQLEITSANFMKIVECTTLVEGVIQGKCIWGRDGATNVLLPESSQPYKDAVAATQRVASSKNIGAKDVKAGDVVEMKDGSTCTYLGSFHILTSALDYKYGYRNYDYTFSQAASKKRYVVQKGATLIASSDLGIARIITSADKAMDAQEAADLINKSITNMSINGGCPYYASVKAAKDIKFSFQKCSPPSKGDTWPRMQRFIKQANGYAPYYSADHDWSYVWVYNTYPEASWLQASFKFQQESGSAQRIPSNQALNAEWFNIVVEVDGKKYTPLM